MPLSGIQVGQNQQLVVSIGDPNTGSQIGAVLPVSDATNPTGKYGGLTFSSHALLNPTGNLDRARSAPGTIGVQSVSPEGTKNTYCSASGGITLAATATDFYTIVGSATKTVRILKITVTGWATSGASPEIALIIRSAADTSGTATQPAITPNDSNNAAATAVINLYSVNPTLGTAVGTIRARKMNLGAAGAAGIIEWKFSDINDQALVLRGVTQLACLSFGGASVPSGTTLAVEVEFVEDNS